MRVGRLRAHNVGQFRDVDIDFSKLPGKLVAVVGENGSGKSTFCELIPGAMYRETPTRGSLAKLATARDGMVEVELLDSGYTIRQHVDSISKKSEASVTNGVGPVLESAKVRDYDAWALTHVPPASVLYCSSFSPQGSEGFAELAASERKRVVLRITQTEKLEGFAELAREYARSSKAAVDTLRARLADLQARTPDVAQSQAESDESRADLERLSQQYVQALLRLDQAKAAEANVAEAKRMWDERERLIKDRALVEAELANTRLKITNNRAVLADEVAIRDAAVELEHWTRESERLKTSISVLRARLQPLSDGVREKESLLVRSKGRLREHRERRDTAAKGLAERAAIEAAVARIAEIDAEVPSREAERAQLRDDVTALHALLVTGKDGRISSLRASLEEIAAGFDADTSKMLASAGLVHDDSAASKEKAAPANIAQKQKEVGALDTYIGGLVQERRSLESMSAKAGRLEQLSQVVAESDQALIVETAECAGYQTAIETLQTERRDLETVAKDIERDVSQALRECDARATKAALLPRLEVATARVEELTPIEARMVDTIGALTQQIEALPSTPPGESSVSAAQRDHDHASAQLDNARQRATRAALTLEAAQSAQSVIAKLEAEVAAAADDLSDWTRLGADLGKDGLQALIVDAALPQLNTLANDLLHSCHGPRFTIEITTQRVSGDGKRMLEDLDVLVTDTEHGRVDAIETYSGGERVILGEAVALALTMVACQAAGLKHPTLVRDESGAALSEANGRAYLAMLRRAVDVLDADRCLFVSHNRELQELADARIVIANGTATVQ